MLRAQLTNLLFELLRVQISEIGLLSGGSYLVLDVGVCFLESVERLFSPVDVRILVFELLITLLFLRLELGGCLRLTTLLSL